MASLIWAPRLAVRSRSITCRCRPVIGGFLGLMRRPGTSASPGRSGAWPVLQAGGTAYPLCQTAAGRLERPNRSHRAASAGTSAGLTAKNSGSPPPPASSRLLTRWVLAGAAAVIANSHNSARLLTEHWGVPAARTHVVHPGVDSERFSAGAHSADLRSRLSPDGEIVLLSVGRLERRKGHDTALGRARPAPKTGSSPALRHRRRRARATSARRRRSANSDSARRLCLLQP